MSLELARPWALALLALLPLWAWWLRRRPAGAVTFARAGLLAPLSTRGARSRARLPEILRGAAFASLVLALAGPRMRGEVTEATSEGISIVVVVDVSGSMLAEDFRPNRIGAARAAVEGFVKARPQDRIGLVAFAGEALTRVPVTVDHEVVLASVRGLRVGRMGEGTAIGMGLATAVSRLRRLPGSRAIVLLTDGESNRGEIEPRAAARAAAAFGIRVHTIGVGSRGMARIPVQTPDGIQYGMLPVSLDEALLSHIASSTGGRYFRAADVGALRRVYAEIDRLTRTPLRVRRYSRARPLHLPLLLLGAAFLLAEWAVRGGRRGRLLP